MMASASKEILAFTPAAWETGHDFWPSRDLRPVMDTLRLVAPADTTVLIQGDTGAGRELIARAIHEHSHRRQDPTRRSAVRQYR